jgi:hypothetical protein
MTRPSYYERRIIIYTLKYRDRTVSNLLFLFDIGLTPEHNRAPQVRSVGGLHRATKTKLMAECYDILSWRVHGEHRGIFKTKLIIKPVTVHSELFKSQLLSSTSSTRLRMARRGLA